MFNTEIYFSTFIYILVLLILIIQVLFNTITRENISYKIRLLLLLLFGLIYNIIEGLLPDRHFPIDLLTQNIIAWSVGIIVAFYTFFYIKIEFNINIIRPLTITSLSYIISISFIFLFIVPYNYTKSLDTARKLFLEIPLLTLILSIFSTCYKQYKEFENYNNLYLKIHTACGIGGLLGVTSLPITILLFGDNQLIEQTFFSLGIFIMYIDYLFLNQRNKVYENKINLGNLTKREKDVLDLILNNPDKKHLELSKKIFISEKTFSSHMSNIYKKLDVKGKKELLDKYS